MRKAKRLSQLRLDFFANTSKQWHYLLDHPNNERALLDGCWFDDDQAALVRRFYSRLLRIPDRGGKTRPFKLLPWWHRYVIGPLFGWKRADGSRRFRKGLVTTAKKSAKSTVFAGLPLYMLAYDNEDEAEVYSAAVDRDQAKIIYRKTARMVELSRHLRRVMRVRESRHRIIFPRTASFYEALAADADSSEGMNPHLIICDEVAFWRDRAFFESLMYGEIAREQPLFLMITTAGDGETIDSIGLEEYEFAKDLLDPDLDFYSMEHFAFIAEAGYDFRTNRAVKFTDQETGQERPYDEKLDFENPKCWIQANPSVGKGYRLPTVASLRGKIDEAVKTPRKRRKAAQYIHNVWGSGVASRWIDDDLWAKNNHEPFAPGAHDGMVCGGGLDLSRTKDLTSLCLAFHVAKRLAFRWWFWMPEENVLAFEKAWRVPLRDWVNAGWIVPTAGSYVDFDSLRQTITGVVVDEQGNAKKERLPDCLATRYRISGICFDRWQAAHLVGQLGNYDGIPVIEHGQGYRDMSPTAKELEAELKAGNVDTGGNPVAAWMYRHCIIDTDPADNIKPNRKKSRQKIDGVIGSIMAKRALGVKPQKPEPGYRRHGLVTIGADGKVETF